MQYATPPCQLEHPRPGDSSRISLLPGDVDATDPTHDTHTHKVEFERTHDYSAGHGRGALPTVIAASQWLHATTGRIATCAHSWMTAVHWVAGLAAKRLYVPARTHGPKFGLTTLQIAQEIAGLSECRPSVDYLARKLRVAKRTVQYHLGMLREAGLLVYRSKGTRISGIGGRASEFERVIPAAFDEALGIRTVGEGATRRPCGAAKESRKQLGKLAKKAARKVRRRRTKTPVSGQGLCTPMEGGTSASSPAAGNYSPSESKLASGKKTSPTPKQQKNRTRKLNKVGRRYQLAAELISMMPWLAKASRARIAWIVRDFADAGWTATEVWAAAELAPASSSEPKRPSGVLAHRLAARALRSATKAQRKQLVDDWRDSKTATHTRHSADKDTYEGARRPASISVGKLVAEAFRRNAEAVSATAYTTCHTDSDDTAIEDLDRATVLQMRADAQADPELILTALAFMPEADVRRLYTNWLVDQTLKAERTVAAAF